MQTYNELFGVTNNPWAFDRITGGSSGGAAAAVAAGFTSFELGTDIGGSVRIPSHCCGVYGLKPTWGVIPQRGYLDHPNGGTIDVDINVFGPIARSAEDLDLLLSVLAGPEPERAVAWRLELPPAEEHSLGDLDVGVWFDEEAAVDRLGVRDDARAPPPTAWPTPGCGCTIDHPDGRVRGAERALRDDDRRRHGADAAPRGPTSTTRPLALSSGSAARCSATTCGSVWHRWFEHHDLLLCPVMATPAFPHDHTGTIMDRTVEVDGTTRGHIELISWLGFIGVLGLPSVVVPIGRTAGRAAGGHADRRTLVPRLPRHPRRGADDRRARWLRVAAGVLERTSRGCRARGGGAPFPRGRGRGWSPL